MIRLSALLALALAASPGQASDVEYFTAMAYGTLTVGADGSVLEVDIQGGRPGRLGKAVLEGIEDRIRGWRFEPVSEGGAPVNAVGRMSLSLMAAREKGVGEATFGIRKVTFMDPPGSAGTPGARPRDHLPKPAYPRTPASMGVGAEVLLAMKIGASGEVVDVATQAVWLLGNVPDKHVQRVRLARTLSRSAENATKAWKFEGIAEGVVLVAPMRYHPRSDSAWLRTVAMPVDVPAWVLASQADKTAVMFGDDGERLSSRIRLDADLKDPIQPAAGG